MYHECKCDNPRDILTNPDVSAFTDIERWLAIRLDMLETVTLKEDVNLALPDSATVRYLGTTMSRSMCSFT